MPELVHAKIVLEGRSSRESRIDVRADLTCVRGLLDDIATMHQAEFRMMFGKASGQELFLEWQTNGVPSSSVPAWLDGLRKIAFEAESLGEASMELRNKNDLPDFAPGVVPVLCAILEYLAGSCGAAGYTELVSPSNS